MSEQEKRDDKLALSNSQLNRENLPFEVEPVKKLGIFDLEYYKMQKGFDNAYIDRLTIVGNLPLENDSLLEGWRGDCLWKNLAMYEGGGFKSQIFDDFAQKMFVEFDPLNAAKMKKRNFRIDLNPNLLQEVQLNYLFDRMVPHISNVAISRIDLAFDFVRDLHDFKFDKSVSGGMYWGRNGSVETIYFGSATSDFRCRLYNKKLERLLKGSSSEKEDIQKYDVLWRLEYVLKGSGYIAKQIRDGFHAIQDVKITKRNYDIPLDVPLSPLEKIMLKAYDNDKHSFSKLSDKTKRRYSKLASEISDVDLSDNLRNVIRQIQVCSDNPIKVDAVTFCEDIVSKRNPLRLGKA